MPTIKSKPGLEYALIQKVGSITLEYGMSGSTLEKELKAARASFLHSMELRGMTLYSKPGFRNPAWVTNEDGSPMAIYAIDWEGKRKPRLGPDGLPLPRVRETSLEESEGEVEYRIVGVFWAPKVPMEVPVARDDIRQAERAARNPMVFGPSRLPLPR